MFYEKGHVETLEHVEKGPHNRIIAVQLLAFFDQYFED